MVDKAVVFLSGKRQLFYLGSCCGGQAVAAINYEEDIL